MIMLFMKTYINSRSGEQIKVVDVWQFQYSCCLANITRNRTVCSGQQLSRSTINELLVEIQCTFIIGWIIWAPSREFVSSSIPSWQILTAHAQSFRGARDLAFCLKVPLDSLLVWASSEGSGETARMRRLAWTFAARIGDKYQIRLTRSIYGHHFLSCEEKCYTTRSQYPFSFFRLLNVFNYYRTTTQQLTVSLLRINIRIGFYNMEKRIIMVLFWGSPENLIYVTRRIWT